MLTARRAGIALAMSSPFVFVHRLCCHAADPRLLREIALDGLLVEGHGGERVQKSRKEVRACSARPYVFSGDRGHQQEAREAHGWILDRDGGINNDSMIGPLVF